MNGSQRILLIDDDSAIAEMIGVLLPGFRRGPFELDHVANYADGLRSLLTGDYALCLLDYQLGLHNGLELLREAKEVGCPTPIILMTGSGLDGMDLAALDGGAVDFIDKGDLTLRGLERAICYALEITGTLAHLRVMAARDEVTGLPNRREFDRRLREEWQRGTRFQQPLALVMLDIDRFKSVNDTHGHLIGDEALRHVARLLSAQVRPVDCLARYGGDEFAIIMAETDNDAAYATAAHLTALIAATPILVQGKETTIELKLSAGVAAWPDNAPSLQGLIAAADAALYAAKRHESDCVSMARNY